MPAWVIGIKIQYQALLLKYYHSCEIFFNNIQTFHSREFNPSLNSTQLGILVKCWFRLISHDHQDNVSPSLALLLEATCHYVRKCHLVAAASINLNSCTLSISLPGYKNTGRQDSTVLLRLCQTYLPDFGAILVQAEDDGHSRIVRYCNGEACAHKNYSSSSFDS